jgi:hypothetical protein
MYVFVHKEHQSRTAGMNRSNKKLLAVVPGDRLIHYLPLISNVVLMGIG